MAKYPPLFEQFKSWVVQGAKDLHNNIVPAFPSYAHGVDEPGTPQNVRPEFDGMAGGKPSFEQSLAAQAPPSPAPAAAREQDKGIEL